MMQHQQCIGWSIKLVLIGQARKEMPYVIKMPHGFSYFNHIKAK
jgi:hypothetical protein